jgi:hypothetical protein
MKKCIKMKKLILFSVVGLFLASCAGNDKERYKFEEERVLDLETGDEYYFKNLDTMTVVHIDGVTEPVTVESTPFAENAALAEMMENYRENLANRKQELLQEQKEIIQQQRIERYEAYNDEELMDYFDKLHEEEEPFERQMDVITELVRREVIGEADAPKLLEVDISEVDFDVSIADVAEEEGN